MTAPIADLLAPIESPGTFATRLRAPVDDIDVKVMGVGPLKVPITAGLRESVKTPFTGAQGIIVANSHELPGDEALDGMRVELFTRDYQGRRGSIPKAGGPA
jgi:hypothetical protein